MATDKSEARLDYNGAFYRKQYQSEARRLVQTGMESAGISCRELASRLTSLGLPHSADGLATKISRGTFSAAFLLICLRLVKSNTDIRTSWSD